MQQQQQQRVTITSLVREYVAQHPGFVALYVLALLMNPVKELLVPHLFGRIVRALQENENVMGLFCWVVVVWAVVQAVFTYIDWQDVHYYPAMMGFLRAKVFGHVLDVHRENFDDLKTFETIAKQSKLPILIYGFLDMWKRTFIPQAVIFGFALVYIGLFDPPAALVMGLLVALVVALVLASPKRCEEASQGKDAAYNAMNEQTEDVMRNMMAVLNAVNEGREGGLLQRSHEAYSALCRATMLCVIGVQARLLPLQVVFMSFMIWRCYRMSHQDVGRAVSLLLIVLSLSGGLTRVFAETRDLIIKWGMVKESMTIFDNAPAAQQCGSAVPPAAPGSAGADAQIELRDVTFGYRHSTQPVLERVSLAVPHRQRLLVVGRIGSGKSTLLKLIMRYKRPSAGELLLEGVPYCRTTAAQVRRRIGYVPQVPLLFNRSIYENIVYGSEERGLTPAQVEAMIRDLGLESLFDNLDTGIMSPAGKNGSRLSGGQRQVVWILRVLLQEPEILLLDEPTASIDTATKDVIYSLLEMLMRDRTVVMVTHDNYLLQHCDRVVELGERGTVLYDGPPPPR